MRWLAGRGGNDHNPFTSWLQPLNRRLPALPPHLPPHLSSLPSITSSSLHSTHIPTPPSTPTPHTTLSAPHSTQLPPLTPHTSILYTTHLPSLTPHTSHTSHHHQQHYPSPLSLTPPPPTHPQHHILPVVPAVQYVRVDTVAATQVETFWTLLQNMPRRTGRGHRHNGLIRNLAKLEDEEGGRREERHRKSSHET